VIAHVVAFTDKPGIAGEIEHDVAPDEVGVCVVKAEPAIAVPTVSTTLVGLNESVGFEINTVTFNMAEVEPVLFVAVTV
jgi:hypothetical protein